MGKKLRNKQLRFAMAQFGIKPNAHFPLALEALALHIGVDLRSRRPRDWGDAIHSHLIRTDPASLPKIAAISKKDKSLMRSAWKEIKTANGNPISKGKISDFYQSWEWKRARYEFLKDKHRRCQCCGATPENGIMIVVDHIRPIRLYWHLRLVQENFQMLCNDCNMGKGSHDETDWRAAAGGNIVPFPNVNGD